MQKLVFILLFLTLALSPNLVFSQDKDSFKTIVNTGVQYYSAGNYAQAIDAFKKASAIQENADVTYNIARSYHRLNDCQNALMYYAKFQTQVSSNEEKQAVEKYIQELSGCKQEGKILPLCSPANTTVRIDESKETLKCGNIHSVAVGNRKLLFEAQGHEPVTRLINVIANNTTTVSVTLDGQAPAPAEPVVSQESTPEPESGQSLPSQKSDSADRGLNWLGLGFVIAGGSSSLLGGILLGASHSEIQNNEVYRRNKGAYYSGWVFTGLGAAATITGLVVLILDLRVSVSIDRVALSPIFEAGPDSAHAGIHLQF